MRLEGSDRRSRSRSSDDNPAVLTFTWGLVVGLRRDSATRSATAIVNEPSPPKITPSRGAAKELRPRLSAPTRAELYGAETTIFHQGERDKADLLLFERSGEPPLIVKDFEHKPPWGRTVGRLMVSREVRAYEKLGPTPGIPRFAGRIDARAFAIERIEGTPLAFAPDRTEDGPGKLRQLREILDRMHRAGIVHLDLRGRENVILDTRGRIYVIDLASAVWLRPGSWRHRLLFGWLEKMDEAACLKWKTIVEAGPFTDDEQKFVDRFRMLRPLWFHRRQAWRGKTRPRV
jgi:hypothetical protein